MRGEKEKFIKGIARCLGRDEIASSAPPFRLPHDVHHRYLKDADATELTHAFIQNCETAGTTAYQCDGSTLNQTITRAVKAFATSGPIVLADHDFFTRAKTMEELTKQFPQLSTWDLSRSREENIETAERAAVGIAKAELALAESGTVLLFSHLGSGRSVSLLPTYTITVIRRQDIRPRLTQGMSFLREQIETGLPASINFISGASSTADIELVRVQGVHGPLATAYVIVS